MFSQFVSSYMSHLLISVPLTMVTTLISFMMWMKFNHNLWWTDFWVMFPIFGKMRKWAEITGDLTNRESWGKEQMPQAERQLCAEYLDQRKNPTAGKEDFERAREYLKITHQMDITPTSTWMWLLLIILTVAEAAGTGLLIAPFVATEITGNEMIWIGYALALVMAAGLLGLTHYAGSQTRKFSTIRNHIGKVGKSHEHLLTRSINCGDDQSIDEVIEGKDAPQTAKIRFANRVLEGAHDRGTLVWVFVVLLVLASLLGGITWMRIEGIKIQMTNQTVQQTQTDSGTPGNIFANIPGMGKSVQAPDEVKKSADKAKTKTVYELAHEKFMQGIAGAVVLALIYLITQGLGFLHALKHSFVGSGLKGYRLTRGESSYSTYKTKYVIPVINCAQKRLLDLRSRLSENADYRKNPSIMSVNDYLARRQQEHDTEVYSGNDSDVSQGNVASAPKPAVSETAQASPAAAASGSNDDAAIREARKILAESDSDMRHKLLDYASDGNTEKRAAILTAIKQIKEEEARAEAERNREDELKRMEDDLL